MRNNILRPDDNFVPSPVRLADLPAFKSLAGNDEFDQLIAEYERRKQVSGERVREIFEEAGFSPVGT